MGFLEKATAISFAVKGAAPGKAVIIQTIAAGNQERTSEMYHNPGISSAPTKNDRIISIPVGTGTRVAIATHNYRINVEVTDGETKVYSTDATGENVKSVIKLDNAGNIDLNGDSKKFVTYTELNTALQSFKTTIEASIASAIIGHTHSGVTTGPGVSGPGAGAGSAIALDISASETTTIRTGG